MYWSLSIGLADQIVNLTASVPFESSPRYQEAEIARCYIKHSVRKLPFQEAGYQ